MRTQISRIWLPFALFLVLATFTALTVAPYGNNLTALFHMDTLLADQHPMPKGFVILDIPSYDGAQYWQIARNIPKIFSPALWSDLAAASPGPYAYQRILLPAFAFMLAMGQDALLPYAFLLIQFFCLLGTYALIVRRFPQAKLYACALALSPAALIALHFSLAEPLTILLLTAFLLRTQDRARLTAFDILLLCLLVLTREVNILFVALFFLYCLFKRRWHDGALLLIPAGVFLGWHAVIYGIFHAIPFLWSTEKNAWPFQAILELLLGKYGYNHYTFSSIALALFFVLPAILWTAVYIFRKRDTSFLPIATLAFLGLMTLMPNHIWGSITSIGRVITPVYPLFLLTVLQRDSRITRMVALAILLLGCAAGLGLAFSFHPFHVTL